jgi:AraC-like DNA-binding protein
VYIYNIEGELLQTLPYAQYGIGAIYHAMEDNRGRLWLSTKGDGLILATPDSSQPMGYQLTHYRNAKDNPASISGNNVYYTFIDSKERIWVGTLDGGLNLVEEHTDGQLTFYNKHNGFKHYPAYGLYTEVRNITEDRQGTLWVGTLNGLMSLNGDFSKPQDIQFKTYHNTQTATFANNDIYTLHRDQTGQIWIGAFGGGLQRLVIDDSTVRFSPLGPREGLRNDVIYSITEDQHGRLWFATEAGLSCYNQQTGRIRNFDRYDGIPNVQMEETAATCCSDGHLWIGTNLGVLTFNPEQLQSSKVRYNTCIIDIATDNQSYVGPIAIPYSEQIELEHNQNSFIIEFAALKFQDHSQVSYRYKLEGYDRDWHYPGPHRVAPYNEVPPGNYTFVVESIDDANPTLQSSARIKVRILPPWWATWWAYLIYICVAILIVWLIVRTMLQMNRMRNEIYISQRLAKLTSKPDEADEFIDRLHRIIRQNIPNSDYNIDDMAAEMGVSRSAFYKKVKAATGFAPVDLIKEFRLSHAAELLQTTNLNITEIAYRSGFKDASYFGKCFRKRFGMSAREYINQQ